MRKRMIAAMLLVVLAVVAALLAVLYGNANRIARALG